MARQDTTKKYKQHIKSSGNFYHDYPRQRHSQRMLFVKYINNN